MVVNVSGITGQGSGHGTQPAGEDEAALALRTALQKLGGLHHMMRPANVTTADQFNERIDGICAELGRLKIAEPTPEPVTKREETGGRDRMERDGKTRARKSNEPKGTSD